MLIYYTLLDLTLWTSCHQTGVFLTFLLLDFLTTIISLCDRALYMIPTLVLDLWPQVIMIIVFALAIVQNGGITYGEFCPNFSGSQTSLPRPLTNHHQLTTKQATNPIT